MGSKQVTWHRPGPRNLCVAKTFYRESDGEGRHAFLYPEDGQVVIRTRDAGFKRPPRVDYRPDLRSAKKLVERRAARGQQ